MVVRLGSNGDFADDVRREFILPDFFKQTQDISCAGRDGRPRLAVMADIIDMTGGKARLARDGA